MQPYLKSPYKSLLKLAGIFLCLLLALPAHALTASEILQKGKDKLSSAKTVTAGFSMKTGGATVSGQLICKGNKFAITSNASSSWYNGVDLYTYLPSKSETTVFKPTASELSDVNPLLYLNTSGNYNVTATKTKKAGMETVVLLPKKSGGSVKSVTIDLDSKTFLPKQIKILPSSGGSIEVTIRDIKLNSNISDSSFSYPKSKYPKARIIDMR